MPAKKWVIFVDPRHRSVRQCFEGTTTQCRAYILRQSFQHQYHTINPERLGYWEQKVANGSLTPLDKRGEALAPAPPPKVDKLPPPPPRVAEALESLPATTAGRVWLDTETGVIRAGASNNSIALAKPGGRNAKEVDANTKLILAAKEMAYEILRMRLVLQELSE